MSEDILLEARNLTAVFSKAVNSRQGIDLSKIFHAIIHGNQSDDSAITANEFRAVNDISLTLRAGDSLGLIGVNGSGKSTLLRMLAGFLQPTSGEVRQNCRIQAMINLNAGFMPHFTGLENIRLAASLFGIQADKMNAFEEEVVEFADIGDFISSPIKNYSSGMKARLGYAVSALIGAQLLLIDEVLAVGDTQFQNKCRAHIEMLKRQGVSIVLVSHSNTHIMQLCQHALWIHKGNEMAFGTSKEILEKYEAHFDTSKKETGQKKPLDLYGPLYPMLAPLQKAAISINGARPDADIVSCKTGASLTVDCMFDFSRPVQNFNFTVNIYREDGLLISGYNSLNKEVFGATIPAGNQRVRLIIPHLSLAPGSYVVVVPVQEGQSYLQREISCKLAVEKAEALTFGLLLDRHHYEIG